MMDWTPFEIGESGTRPEPPRSIHTPEGVGDRMRTAAFAELQAREAFLWAADRFNDVPESLAQAWRKLSIDEQRHYDWIMTRMAELGVDPKARKVSDQLWISLQNCNSARDFAIYIANAEERGRRAGVRFWGDLKGSDPTTAEIFRKIAEDEISHVALAYEYFPQQA